jgi:phage gp29-like protein
MQDGAPALTDAQEQTLNDIAGSLRQNEEAFVKTPPGIKFRFEPSPGLDADKYKSAILFFRTWALATALAEFITLGTGDTGSFALGQSKIDLFLKALTGYQDKLCEAINRQAITRLFRYNDFGKLTDLPRVSLPAVKEYDLNGLSNFAQVLSGIGMFHPTPEDEAWARKVSDLPDIDMTEIEAMHEQDEEQPNAIQTGSTAALIQTDDDPSTAEEDLSVDEETQEDRR